MQGHAQVLPPPSQPRHTGVILTGTLAMYGLLQTTLALLGSRLDQTISWIAATALVLGTALVLERIFFGRRPRAALLALGYGRPLRRALVVSAVLCALVMAYFPLAALAGAEISLRREWLWVLVGAVALNGFAEETMFRGFLFGHLRAEGRTFRNAMGISMGVFVGAHLYLFLGNHPAVALAAMLVAMTTGFAYAYLFERGGNTIWALIALHTSTHAVRLFDIADAHQLPVLLGWMLLQLGAPFLVFLFRRYLESTPAPSAETAHAPLLSGTPAGG